jgi:hypothetical protein
VPDRDLAAAPVSRGFAVAPVHASFVGAGRPTTVRPPAAVLNRTVVTMRTPAAPPARFEEGGPGAPGAPANRGGNPPPVRTLQPTQPQPSQPQPGFRPPPRTVDEQSASPTPQGGAGFNRNPAPAANPYARPAPPVRQPTPAEQQNDAAKQTQWQQQHQEVHQKPAGKPAEKPARRDKKN